jgi:hypothetical protein
MPLANNIALSVISGQFVDYQGNGVAGQVKFTLSKTLLDAIADQIIVPSTITATLDSNGSFTTTLPATDDPDLSEVFTYFVEESFAGGRSYSISLPAINPQTRTNLCTNPSAESNVSLTTPVNGAVDSNYSNFETGTTANSGASFAFTSTGGVGGLYWNRIPVTTNLSYAWSGSLKNVDAAGNFQAGIRWYTAQTGGTLVSTSLGTSTALSTSAWTRLSVIATAPATATYAEPFFYSVSSLTNATSLYIDACLFEQASSVKTFFDGFTTNIGGNPYWLGTPNLSASVFPEFGGLINYATISPTFTITPTYTTFPNVNEWATLDSTVQTMDSYIDQPNTQFAILNPPYQTLPLKTYSYLAANYTYATLKSGPFVIVNADLVPYIAIAQSYQSAAEASNASAQLSLSQIVTDDKVSLHPFFVTGG